MSLEGANSDWLLLAITFGVVRSSASSKYPLCGACKGREKILVYVSKIKRQN